MAGTWDKKRSRKTATPGAGSSGAWDAHAARIHRELLQGLATGHDTREFEERAPNSLSHLGWMIRQAYEFAARIGVSEACLQHAIVDAITQAIVGEMSGRYDEARGYRFSSWAGQVVRNSIYVHRNRTCRLCRRLEVLDDMSDPSDDDEWVRDRRREVTPNHLADVDADPSLQYDADPRLDEVKRWLEDNPEWRRVTETLGMNRDDAAQHLGVGEGVGEGVVRYQRARLYRAARHFFSPEEGTA